MSLHDGWCSNTQVSGQAIKQTEDGTAALKFKVSSLVVKSLLSASVHGAKPSRWQNSLLDLAVFGRATRSLTSVDLNKQAGSKTRN
ncbi:hypothetical protein O9992_03890 [Vibrio lentus]|nr:hypothetical protein [Vibrio lentus]